MRRLLAGVVALLLAATVVATPVSAQSGVSVRQSGASVNPATVPYWVTNGVIGSQVTAADSPVTSFGVTSNGSAGICVNSDRITAAGRNQLCLGAQTSGPATISLQNQGSAAPQGLNFVINGVPATFPTPTTPLAISSGGTGATTAAGAQTNLGLGSMATQFSNAVAITGGTITGLPIPTNPPDAATKAYADGLAAGLTILAPSRLATAAALPNTPTYSNGASGVGATLTAGTNSTLTVDGTVANLNDVVLVNNQAAPAQNGIYTVTNAGSGAAAWVLTRATYFNTSALMKVGSYTFITAGSTNVNTSWVLSANVTTVGTTAVVFNQFANTNITANSVINADLAQMPANTVKCNPTTSTANAQDCTSVVMGSAFTATQNYPGSNGQTIFQGVLGTSGAPNSVDDAPFIFQKWSTGVTNTNPAGYFATWKTGSAPNTRAQALYAEAQDTGGWSGTGAVSFVEGIRSQGTLSGGSLGSAYGVVCAAGDNTSITYTFLVGCEANTLNNSGADAPILFNKNSFVAGFLASENGTNKGDAGFIVNPNNTQTYRVGFLVGETSTDQAAFRSRAATVFGLDLSQGTQSFAAIAIPNNTAITGQNAANNAALNMAFVDPSNRLELGTGAVSTMPSGGAPSVVSCTNLGAGGTCTLLTGSVNNVGKIVLTSGSSGTQSAGNVTLTFSAAIGPNNASCTFTPENASGSWTAPATMLGQTISASSYQFTWNNGGANLTAGSTYRIGYVCFGF